jgi:hypothetical protein
MTNFPHVLLLPLKIAGIFFLPFHWYLAKKVESSAQNTTSKPLLSLIALPLFWLHRKYFSAKTNQIGLLLPYSLVD